MDLLRIEMKIWIMDEVELEFSDNEQRPKLLEKVGNKDQDKTGLV